jgi:simple sugar transport system substrate-binding protein
VHKGVNSIEKIINNPVDRQRRLIQSQSRQPAPSLRPTSRGLRRLVLAFFYPQMISIKKFLNITVGVTLLSAAQFLPAAPTPGKPLTFFSVIHGDVSDPFWAVYRKGLVDASKLYNVQIKDLGTQVTSVQAEVDLFNSALAAKPDGIITTIPDPQAFEESLKRAADQHIPVIAVNVADPRPAAQRVPYLFYIGGDEYLGGQAAAQRVLKSKKPKSTACWIQEPGHTGLEARAKGWTDEMTKAGVKTETITYRVNNATEAAEALTGFLRSHPDLDTLFCEGSVNTGIALQVLDEMKKSEQITLFGFDFNKAITDAIESGKLLGTVEQQQYLQGYLGVEFMRLYLDDQFLPSGDLLTGPNVVDKDNLEKIKESVAAGYR